jgi:hypothetical protein
MFAKVRKDKQDLPFDSRKNSLTLSKRNEMNIQALKIELVKRILNTESEELLNRLYSTLKVESKDFWLELTDAQRREVEIGLEQIQSGKTIDLEDFLKEVS